MAVVRQQPLSLAAARRLLRDLETGIVYCRAFHPGLEGASCGLAVPGVYDRGHQWVQQAFLPALRVLSQSTRKADRLQAAAGYYVLGDVHDSNDAPRAAIRAYLRSARLWPASGSAWREISMEYDAMGQHDNALRALRKSVRIDPTDEIATADLPSFEECSPSSPLYRVGDPFWESSELLASGRHRQAIAVLAGKRSPRADRYRARAYGARGDGIRFLELWDSIARRNGRLKIEGPDWFFPPRSVWDGPEFWTILSRVSDRIEDWPPLIGHEGLVEAGISGRERFELVLRYHLSRTQRNVSAARRLSARYPGWKEATDLVKSLKTIRPKKKSRQQSRRGSCRAAQ